MRRSFVLILLSFWLFESNAQSIDLRLLQSFNSPSPRHDKFWIGISQSAIPVSIATPLCFYILGQSKHWPEGKNQAFVAAGSLAMNSMITFGLKYSIQRERPYVTHQDIFKKTKTGPYSFPSGHSSLAFATATNLSLAYPKWYVAVPAYLWAGSVGYSRMHLGVHYPSDVLAGALVGCLSGFLAHKMNQKMMK